MTITSQELINEPLWIFGYGSLMFKPPLHDLPEISSQLVRFHGHIPGYIRRFWQSSSDHRGTPELPGRVATIIGADEICTSISLQESLIEHELNHLPSNEARELFTTPEKLTPLLQLGGCVYRVPPKYAQRARDYLDFREKDGYTSHSVQFTVCDEEKNHPLLQDLSKNNDGNPIIPCTVYVGTSCNPSYVGPESLSDTAAVIITSKGPSGPNIEYFNGILSQDPQDPYLVALSDMITQSSNPVSSSLKY
ncbi:hypothetical protein CANINC_004229 [Pichia inconspicua]|uniref:glutathione-specific gamma-glutamylcyclotransferase n=1 Tax=Pichia inconspicua TaxID=52247 RepID=A0A4T0WWQ1_9ASCO|nr:hypothetical protein CANINC_004229 [[Candida] inconspicua]